jgi:hypothetical protein
MSPSSVPKPNSTQRRKILAKSVEALGSKAMAPCPQCQSSNSTCVVHKSSKSCAACLRKNIPCGGRFSEAEFDKLEARKVKLRTQKMEARARLRTLAWEMMAAYKEDAKLDAELSRIQDRQEQMMEEEARALDELDLFVEAGNPEVALMSDLDFSLGDPSWEQLLIEPPDGGGTPPSVPEGGSR